jgi:tetratricopeptide (TPR) repeat protein
MNSSKIFSKRLELRSLTLVAGVTLLAPSLAHARIALIASEDELYEIPRSQTKTYIQRETLDKNLKPIKAAKPGALSDEELAAIPERYLPPDLLKKQKEIKARLKAQKDNKKKTFVADHRNFPMRDADVVKIKGKKHKIINLKIDEAVWVPPTAATDDAILAPQRKLPDVELLQKIKIETSGAVKEEIRPGDTREVVELFKNGKTTDKDKVPLLKAYQAYALKDYATSLTLALGVMGDDKSNAETRVTARYLAAHSLYQAGFYASSLPLLTELVTTKWRRSALGMATHALEKTRDDGAANQILAHISISQMPDELRPLFSFHLGRILFNTGAREAALAAFKRVTPDNPRYPEAQYFMGVIRTADVPANVEAGDWERKGSGVFEAREDFERALVSAQVSSQGDLMNLIRLSMARLAYQAKQYNQSIYYYQEVTTGSPFARDALYESAWALYRIGEYNRSLGTLHSLGSAYFEGRDLPELWILRSLDYLKLCRFDEAKTASLTFEKVMKELTPELQAASVASKHVSLRAPSNIAEMQQPEWIRHVLLDDPVIQKDMSTEKLLKMERERLAVLDQNPLVSDAGLKHEVTQVLQENLDHKVQAVGTALKPYIVSRISDLEGEYKGQRDRLDFLRFEIYSQATRFPAALGRPEAKKLIAKGEYLPGVFLKGHEISWRFNGEYWYDEVRGYDYFLPTECKAEGI